MPRASLGARLYLEAERRRDDGTLINAEQWVIRDGPYKRRTGCPKGALGEAQKRLAEYVLEKNAAPPPPPKPSNSRDPADIKIATVLALYVGDKGQDVARRNDLLSRITFLDAFWGEKMLSDVTGTNCRAYAASRVGQPWKHAKPEKTGNAARLVSTSAARRELDDLSAAITYHRNEGHCDRVVAVWRPAKSPPKKDFLTRDEVARLLWAAWRAKQTYKGEPNARPTGKHVARFILMGYYTGTRHDAICGASLTPGPDLGHVDVEAGVYHRLRAGRKETKKRQPSIRIPRKLRVHLARWKRLGIVTGRIVEWAGGGVTSVRKGFDQAAEKAGLGDRATPHILRHTCATWAMKKKVNLWEAAHYLGMTQEMLERVYGAHTLEDEEPPKKLVVTKYVDGINAAFNSPRMVGG